MIFTCFFEMKVCDSTIDYVEDGETRPLADVEDLAPQKPLKFLELPDSQMREIVDILIAGDPQDEKQMTDCMKDISQHMRFTKKLSTMDILYIYRTVCKEFPEIYKLDKKYLELLQTNTVRTNSGVTVVALFTSAYPRVDEEEAGGPKGADGSAGGGGGGGGAWTREFSCKYNCYYCPAFPGNPRSYDPLEPGNSRAQRHDYNVTLQIWDRLQTFLSQGLPIWKCEVLVLGGTWESYPIKYREKFIRLIYYSFNTFLDRERLTRPRPCFSLEREMKINETAPCGVIGLTLETRPDCIGQKELKQFRKWGVTRIQLGIQHFDNSVLDRVNRRTTFEQGVRATKMLLDCCFKVDTHIMLDLIQPLKPEFLDRMRSEIRRRVDLLDKDSPDFTKLREQITYEEEDKATPADMEEKPMIERDREMLDLLFFPYKDIPYGDQIKLYPYAVTPHSRGLEIFNKGMHKSYSDEVIYTEEEVRAEYGGREPTEAERKIYHDKHNKLYYLLRDYYPKIPYYVRCNRLPRDIPSSSIVGGNRCTNIRQYFDSYYAKNKIHIQEMRYSEVKAQTATDESNPANAEAHIFHFTINGGEEYAIQFRSRSMNTLFGFLRLRINGSEDTGVRVFQELEGCAKVRELHVYGPVTKVGAIGTKSQHIGFGKRLLGIAEFISANRGYNKLAVISGNGVKVYYRDRGYVDGENFLIKTLTPENKLPVIEKSLIFHHLTFPGPGEKVDDVEVVEL
jgi:histone acetyltransferase (RNA polymerase elongator complex component)